MKLTKKAYRMYKKLDFLTRNKIMQSLLSDEIKEKRRRRK